MTRPVADLPQGATRCQCASCGEVFKSLSGFDKHRIFVNPKVHDWEQRRCMTPAEMQAEGMSLNAKGWWVSSVWEGRGEGEDAA